MPGKRGLWFRGRRVFAGALIVILLGGVGAVTLNAQEAPPAGTLIGDVLAGIGAILDILVEDVVPALRPDPGPVVLYTGLVSVRAVDQAWCSVTNVSDAAIGPVVGRLVTFSGTVLGVNTSNSLQPGQSSAGATGGFDVIVRCQFEFDGLATDVRAMIFTTSSDGSTIVALDAR